MAPWFFMEVTVSWELTYVERRKSLEEALRAVKRGAKVFLGTACAEPQYLVEGLIDRAGRLHDVQVLHFITLGNAPYTEKRFDTGVNAHVQNLREIYKIWKLKIKNF